MKVIRAFAILIGAFALFTAVVALMVKDYPPVCQSAKCLEGM